MIVRVVWGGFVVVGIAIAVLVMWPATPTKVVRVTPADAAPIVLSSDQKPTPAPLTVMRIAHASVLLNFNGETVLTDPWFTDTEEYHHGELLGISLSQLPRLSAVVVSHNHFDHFDIKAFAAYPDKGVPFFVAHGMAKAARSAGFTNVQELAPWQSAHAGPLTITATPGKHNVPEVTYVIQGFGNSVFFGGDTELIPELSDVAVRFPEIDLALLSVNGLQVLHKPVVMNDEEAAKLASILSAKVVVPIHYAFVGGILSDTFALSYHGTAEGFAQKTASIAPKTIVRVLSPGQTLTITRTSQR